MEKNDRGEDGSRGARREAAHNDNGDRPSEQRDELARRRERTEDHPAALTPREQEERWPIG